MERIFFAALFSFKRAVEREARAQRKKLNEVLYAKETLNGNDIASSCLTVRQMGIDFMKPNVHVKVATECVLFEPVPVCL